MEIPYVPLTWPQRAILGFAIAGAAAGCFTFWFILHLLIQRFG